MNKYCIKVTAADGYHNTSDLENSELKGELLSWPPTTQKVNSFVTFCIENQSSHVSDERRRELVPYTISGWIFMNNLFFEGFLKAFYCYCYGLLSNVGLRHQHPGAYTEKNVKKTKKTKKNLIV